MSLITSISGIRGTIGGNSTDGLNPINIAEFTSAYATFIKEYSPIKSNKVVVGRDARISGDIVSNIVVSTLRAMGLDVVDIGLATTPTTEVAVVQEGADGGIIITASHNPRQWNALKLLNHRGEFLSAMEGERIVEIGGNRSFDYATVDHLGGVYRKDYTLKHIEEILALPDIDIDAIRNADFCVVVDCINSVGSIAVPPLLEALGVKRVLLLNGEPTGDFAHNPEPLAEHLVGLSQAVVENGADVGFAVDPDVDRLAIVCEDGKMFGEENTLVSIADYILDKRGGGTTVSNLSSSRALCDISLARGGSYYAAAVGEVNVVAKMKEVGAVIGGEGNGGVIFPEIHYGRDALVGIALYLTILAKRSLRPTQLLTTIPEYYMSKDKVIIPEGIDLNALLKHIAQYYAKEELITIDGVKINFPTKWVHVRRSNTEPIVRIYTEAPTIQEAKALSDEIKSTIALFIAENKTV